MEFSKPLELEYYTDISGKNHFDLWLDTLPERIALKIAFEVGKLQVGLGKTRSLGEGLQEQKIRIGSLGFRVYFSYYEGRMVVILMGSDKEDQRRTIPKARALLEEMRQVKRKKKLDEKHDTR
jgi:putative addiction module killer protein